MKRLLSIAAVLSFTLTLPTTAAEVPADLDQKYEQVLYNLGAFPVAKLTKPYFNNGNPGQVFQRGSRMDVDGWLPPRWTPRFLTEDEKRRYGIPKPAMSYAQYVALLDVDAYQRSRNPKLHLILRFTLDSLQERRIPIQKQDILRVYEARIGLEQEALRLLHGQLGSDDVMRLTREFHDERLADTFPAPKPDEAAYIAFLNERADDTRWSLLSRLRVHQLLFAFDDKRYREPYRGFLMANVKSGEGWYERAHLYIGLIGFKEDETWKAVNDGLLNDPATEVRELILYHLKEQSEVAPVIDTIILLSQGRGATHRGKTPSRPPFGLTYRLGEYLKWAKERKDLDPRTAKKVDEAIDLLAANKVPG